MQINIEDLEDAAKERVSLAFRNSAINNYEIALNGMRGELAYGKLFPNASSRMLHEDDTGYDFIHKGLLVDVKVRVEPNKAKGYNNRSGFMAELTSPPQELKQDVLLSQIFSGCDVKAIFHATKEGEPLYFIGYAFKHTPIVSIVPIKGSSNRYYINYNIAELWKLR